MNKTTLVRLVEGRERYYTISINPNLLGEFELDRIYGAVRNKKPTGIKREFFDSLEKAVVVLNGTVKQKLAKGYSRLSVLTKI